MRAAPRTIFPPPLPDYEVLLRRKGDGAVSAGRRGRLGHLSAHILFPNLRRLGRGKLFAFGFSYGGHYGEGPVPGASSPHHIGVGVV